MTSDGWLGLGDLIQILREVPLFADLPVDELGDLVRVMQPIKRESGALLWRQGEVADGLHVIVDGEIMVSLRRPGGVQLPVAALGAGDVVGEVPLIDGGTRSASARVERTARLLFLSRADFGALTVRRHPTAAAVRRRICALVCTRLRRNYEHLAASLVPASGNDQPAPTGQAQEIDVARPPIGYLRRLAFFEGFDEPDLNEVVDRSCLRFVTRGHVVAAEGDSPRACYIMLNGAVEEAIERGDRRIPIGLAGPGRAFGYIGLIDGQTSALTATARERSVMLVVSASLFDECLNGSSSASRAFFTAIERDLMRTLRRTDAGFVRAVRSH